MKRYKYISKIIAVCTCATIISSCNNPNPPDPYIRFADLWQFTLIESSVNEVSADPLEQDKDVTDEELFIRFYNNQDFITNADLSLSKLLVSSTNNFSGTYYYFKENGQDRMILEFYDRAIREDVALYFFVQNMSSNNPILIMNTADYRTSITESADEINSDISADLRRFANRIITANFSLQFEKQ